MKIIIIDATVAELKESRILDLIRIPEAATIAPMAAKVTEPETPESASPAVVAAETPEAKPEEVVAALMRADAVNPKKKRVSVDWPKAKALRDAGWSYDKIGG